MNTTSTPDAAILARRRQRLAENRAHLEAPNVRAFLNAIAAAEGGGYDFRYGAVHGRRNDPWRFTDYSTHPGPGRGGRTTAAGMYQITRPPWREMGAKMGLTDFSPATQDLVAVEVLRTIGVLDDIVRGDVGAALDKASHRWAALSRGRGRAGRYPPQPSVSYEAFANRYRLEGGRLA